MANEDKMMYAPNGGLAYDPHTGRPLFKGSAAPGNPTSSGAWYECWFSTHQSASSNTRTGDTFFVPSSASSDSDPHDFVTAHTSNMDALVASLASTYITGTGIVRPFSKWNMWASAPSWESPTSNNLCSESGIDYTLSAVSKLIGITTPGGYRTKWSDVASDLGYADAEAVAKAIKYFRAQTSATFYRQIRWGTAKRDPVGCGDATDIGWWLVFAGNASRLNVGQYSRPADWVQVNTPPVYSSDTIADCVNLAYVSLPPYVYDPPSSEWSSRSETHNGSLRYWPNDPGTDATVTFSTGASYVWI